MSASKPFARRTLPLLTALLLPLGALAQVASAPVPAVVAASQPAAPAPVTNPAEKRANVASPGTLGPEKKVVPQVSVPLSQPAGEDPAKAKLGRAAQQERQPVIGSVDDAVARCRAQTDETERARCRDLATAAASAPAPAPATAPSGQR